MKSLMLQKFLNPYKSYKLRKQRNTRKKRINSMEKLYYKTARGYMYEGMIRNLILNLETCYIV